MKLAKGIKSLSLNVNRFGDEMTATVSIEFTDYFEAERLFNTLRSFEKVFKEEKEESVQ